MKKITTIFMWLNAICAVLGLYIILFLNPYTLTYVMLPANLVVAIMLFVLRRDIDEGR